MFSSHLLFQFESQNLKSGFEGLTNDADGAGKAVFANRKLCQHGLRQGIRRRLQTVLLKITPSQPDPHDAQLCRGGKTFTCRQGHKSIQ
jgi:hypothetical protein